MLLEDINLADIQFTNCGKNIRLDFLDMHEGKPIASMICENVLHVISSNNNTCDGFAFYVGEVTVQTFTSHKDIIRTLSSMGYRFSCSDMNGNILVLHDELYLIGIEGGEISITILCKKSPTLY